MSEEIKNCSDEENNEIENQTEQIIERARQENVPVSYGEDTHILHFEIGRVNLIPKFL